MSQPRIKPVKPIAAPKRIVLADADALVISKTQQEILNLQNSQHRAVQQHQQQMAQLVRLEQEAQQSYQKLMVEMQKKYEAVDMAFDQKELVFVPKPKSN